MDLQSEDLKEQVINLIMQGQAEEAAKKQTQLSSNDVEDIIVKIANFDFAKRVLKFVLAVKKVDSKERYIIFLKKMFEQFVASGAQNQINLRHLYFILVYVLISEGEKDAVKYVEDNITYVAELIQTGGPYTIRTSLDVELGFNQDVPPYLLSGRFGTTWGIYFDEDSLSWQLHAILGGSWGNIARRDESTKEFNTTVTHDMSRLEIVPAINEKAFYFRFPDTDECLFKSDEALDGHKTMFFIKYFSLQA